MQRNDLTIGYLGMGTGYAAPFDLVIPKSKQIRSVADFDDVDVLVIWGGEDISPSLYNEPVDGAYAPDSPSRRDAIEWGAINEARNRNIPIIGVCRGAQMLCAAAGGKLVQDVTGHGRDHEITTFDGRSINTSSVHHQMMWPWDTDHKLIAWSTHARSAHYRGIRADDPNLEKKVEPEIVYFPKIKGLAIQGHPEFMDENCDFVKYCNKLVEEYIVNGK